MTLRTPADSLADVAAELLREHDVADLLLRLTRDATQFARGDAAGILVRTHDGPLELLAATSHRATYIELFQTQRDEGPCVDVIRTGRPVAATGRDEIVARWPGVGPAIVGAGFEAVHAFPLDWQGGVLGGLNIFGRGAEALDDESARAARALASMVTLVIVQPERLRPDEVDRRLRRALGGRVVIEQAKGALAYQMGIDPANAYEVLLERSVREGIPLTQTARQVLREAQQR
ncbi:GAF and ANTAR domain-containing protein [Isoptericola sp. NPDC057653]|uniref:GAF and ANTAR domain-containing protein n=1 Tax=unclassified Isoptericola TaxID=2623355 RepID=UPI0036A92AA7